MEEPKMSLGYQRGNTWVVDTVYQRFVEWDTYKLLIQACREAGFMFDCEFSYTAQRYTAETYSLERMPSGNYRKILAANAYAVNPMQAVVDAIRKRDQMTPMLTILCIEMDCRLIEEKLLPFKRLEDALEALGDTIVLGLR